MAYVTPTSGGSAPSLTSVITRVRTGARTGRVSASQPGPATAAPPTQPFLAVAHGTTSAPSGAQLIGYETTLPSQGSLAYMFRWVAAWGIVLLVLWLINRTAVGHVILYYLLVVMLFFLIATQYKWFAQALAPLTGQLIVPTAAAATPNPIPPAVGGVASAG